MVTFTTAVLKIHSREKFNIKYIITNFLLICNFLEQGQLAWEYIAPTVPRYLSEKYFYSGMGTGPGFSRDGSTRPGIPGSGLGPGWAPGSGISVNPELSVISKYQE